MRSNFDYAHLHNYIDLSKIDSFAGHYVFIDSGRGPGKTSALYDRVVKRFLTRGETFALVRRTKGEAEAIKQSPSPLSGYIEDKYSTHEIKSKGDYILIDGKSAGRIYYLSGNGAKVSKSTGLKNLTTVIFDEFQPEMGSKFLKFEVEKFQTLLATVKRTAPMRKGPTTDPNDDGQNYKVFFLGNSVSFYNPYYDNLGLVPKLEGGVTYNKSKGAVLWHIVSSDMANYNSVSTLSQNSSHNDYITKGTYTDKGDTKEIWTLNGSEYNLGTIEINGVTIGVSQITTGRYGCVYTVKGYGHKYTTSAGGGIPFIGTAPFYEDINDARSFGGIYYENGSIQSLIKNNAPYLANIDK